MVSSRARQRAFADESADLVNKAASAMTSIPTAVSQMQVHQDRRGWEIHLVVAEEEVHRTKEMLEAAKAQITKECQTTKYVRLLGSRNPWRDVRCGFRALIGFMEDETNACADVYELGECANRTQCSKKHPRLIKRLFVVVRSPLMVVGSHLMGSPLMGSMTDHNETHCEGSASTSTGTPSSASAQTVQSWSSASHSGSPSDLHGYSSVEADGSSMPEGAPDPHLSCEADSERPIDIQAPPLHEKAFGIPVEAHLRSRLIISL